jgi:uncharacterized membrane protein YeaQ/YmgE (transglycosylase-associated protein family)
MHDAEIGWIAAIIIGGLAGWFAEMFMKSGTGILANIVLGIVGAAVANFLLERFTDLLNRQGFRTWGEYDSRCWLGWRPASDGATNFQ